MWWAVVVAGIVATGCGGKSRSEVAGPGGGTGGTGAASGGGVVGGGAGMSGNGGTVGGPTAVWSEPPEPGDSPACTAYKQTEDVLEACNHLLSCQESLEVFLTLLADSDEAQYYFARQGCGLTELTVHGGFTGGTYVFDEDGQLAGYLDYSDTTFGPCRVFQYERGLHLADCPDLRECVLTEDLAQAATGGPLCRCACPDPPPADGVADVESACVDRPSRGYTCGENLARWGELGELAPGDGLVRTGCGATVVELWDEHGVLGCVYGDDEALAGSRHRTRTGCAGVDAWQTGVPYAPCPGERLCAFGDGPPDTTAPPCGAYPYQ